jgi:hypothetical protein
MELSPFCGAASVQLLKNFPAFYGTQRFITVFTIALRRSLSWARTIQSIPHRPSLRSVLLLSTHLRLGLPSGLSPPGFLTNILYAFLVPIRATCPTPILINLGETYKMWNSLVCSLLQPHVTSSLFGPSILSALFWNTSVYVPPLMSETKLHTQTEPQAKL